MGDRSIPKIENYSNFLQDIIRNPIVFSAFKTSGNYSHGKYIDGYDGLLTNYGNHFSLSTGIFTAPREGIFEFFTTTESHSRGAANYLNVEKNNVKELQFLKSDDYESPLSLSWMMELKQGDTIRLKSSGGYGFHCTPKANCLFNGKFIRLI